MGWISKALMGEEIRKTITSPSPEAAEISFGPLYFRLIGFEVIPFDERCATIKITWELKDRDTGEIRIFPSIGSWDRQDKTLVNRLRELVKHFVQHEVDEHLYVDGERIFEQHEDYFPAKYTEVKEILQQRIDELELAIRVHRDKVGLTQEEDMELWAHLNDGEQ
jgi:hypothetical protein